MTRQLVIDTSYWSGLVNWQTAVKAGAAAMYTKASQLSVDPTFAANWKNAKGILPRGAFHFLDWHTSELTQAKLFTDTLAGDWGELPPALDLEQNPALFGLSRIQVQTRVLNWLQAVEKTTGRVPMIYSGYYYWIQWVSPDPSWAKYPFWLAWYEPESVIKTPKPWSKWSMWQYTGNGPGRQYGTQGLSLDMSYCDNLPALMTGAPAPVPGPAPLYPAYRVNPGDNPNVHETSQPTSKVIGYLLSGTIVYIDTHDAITGYSHFQPAAPYLNGGWIRSNSITLKAL